MQNKCADFTDSIRQEKRSSDSLFPFFSQQEIRHTREVGMMRQDIPYVERTYLTVPYAERHEAKALGRVQTMKKRLVRGAEQARENIAKWEPKHQPVPTLDPRAEFAAVLG